MLPWPQTDAQETRQTLESKHGQDLRQLQISQTGGTQKAPNASRASSKTETGCTQEAAGQEARQVRFSRSLRVLGLLSFDQHSGLNQGIQRGVSHLRACPHRGVDGGSSLLPKFKPFTPPQFAGVGLMRARGSRCIGPALVISLRCRDVVRLTDWTATAAPWAMAPLQASQQAQWHTQDVGRNGLGHAPHNQTHWRWMR